MTRLSEDALIARYFAPLATLPGADGLRDDAALLTPPAGMSLVITADALVAGVHFLPDDPPETIAAKAPRVNLSDLAAKGAQPYAFTLSLASPGDWTEAWLAGFAAGLGRDAEAYGFALIGGDTVKTPGPLTIAVSAFGLVPSARIPRRAGAAAGDGLYVSGTIGDGAFGLLARRRMWLWLGLPAGMREALITRYRLPQPRVALAPVVLAHASAAMDISTASSATLPAAARLRRLRRGRSRRRAALPAARAAIAGQPRLFEIALTGGDDYEILLAPCRRRLRRLEAQARAAGVAVARIGTITAGAAPPLFRDADGAASDLAAGSFSHFCGESRTLDVRRQRARVDGKPKVAIGPSHVGFAPRRTSTVSTRRPNRRCGGMSMTASPAASRPALMFTLDWTSGTPRLIASASCEAHHHSPATLYNGWPYSA